MKIIITTVLILLSVAVFVNSGIRSITMDQDCTGYLKRAADANTVEGAKKELDRSISYLEANNLTSGFTSIFWRTPDEDIDFWYKNLKDSQNELSKVDSTTSGMERTNLLMKLRETLLDNGSSGDHLTIPQGLSRYPHNGLIGTLEIIALLTIGIVCLYHFVIND